MEYKSNDVCHECEIGDSVPWLLDPNRVYKTALILMTLALNSAELESKQLQTQLDDVNESMGRVDERCAKLRYLVEDMLSCIEIRAAFGRPPTTEMYEEFAQQARELGVEVDR